MVTRPFPSIESLQAAEHHLAHAAISLNLAFMQATDKTAAETLECAHSYAIDALKHVREQILQHPQIPTLEV